MQNRKKEYDSMSPLLNTSSFLLQPHPQHHAGLKPTSRGTFHSSATIPVIQKEVTLLILSSIHIIQLADHHAMDGIIHGTKEHPQMGEKIVRLIRIYMEEELS
jgi:hypothetical protein